MSKIKLFTNPLDAKSLLEYEVEPGVEIIDWLQANYPDGFPGALRVFVGQEEIDLGDLDYPIQELDQVTMLVMPATLGAVAGFVIKTLVTVAVGYVINLLFPPTTPNGDAGGDESPVYSLSPTRNEARLGSPIPSRYGTTTFPPDIAAAPYVFNSYMNEGNDQFVDTLLCLGQGKFDVEAVYIGDTDVSQMEKGTVYYYKTGAGGHYRTMGAFAEIINNKLKNTAYPYPFHENIYTSPELESFEFSDEWSDPNDAGGAIEGDIIAEHEDADGQFFSAQIQGVDATLVIGPGDTITLAGTTSNNGDHYITSVIADPHFEDKKTVFIRQNDDDFVVVDEPDMSGTYSFATVKKNMTAGPYQAQPMGQTVTEIFCDIAFPQGLYRLSSSGNARKRKIDFEISYQEIDPDTGVPVGPPIVNSTFFESRMTNPLRFTVPSGPLPEGAYQVSIERLTNDSDAADIGDLMVWTSLRSALSYTEGWVYGYVTLIMVRMRATHGLASAARSRIRVKARRILENDAVESDNPIEVIRDIWTSARYGLGRNESELSPELETLAQEWATSGPYFNGAFDQKGVGWDALASVASMTGSKAIQDGGYLTVVPDRVQSVRTALFSDANIVRGSLSITYNFDTQGEYDAIQLEWRDPDLFTVEYSYWPPDVDLDDITPDTLTLFGSTDETYSSQFANYLWNVKTKRRKQVEFVTEMEGLIPRFGDRIGVSASMPNWSLSGVIVEVIDTVTFRVDQDLNWETDNVVILRNTLGEPSQAYTVTMGGPDVIVFDTEPTETISVGDGMEPTHYAFGRSYQLVQDFIVSNIVPQDGNLVTVTGQTYDETIFDGAPPHMGGNTP